MSDVLTVGELLADFMAERVGQTFSEPGTFLGPYPGGAPAIFVDQVAKTGTAFVTYRKDGSREFIFNLANSATSLIDADSVDATLTDADPEFSIRQARALSVRAARRRKFRERFACDSVCRPGREDSDDRPDLGCNQG
jgi:tagatose kinase